jgi:hypothetical protein
MARVVVVIKLLVYNKITLIACGDSVCYTEKMQERSFWSTWAQFLQQWGMREPVAAVIEGLGPLSILLAQFIYIGQPFYKFGQTSGQITALAEMLESQDETRNFARYLREEG